MKPTLVIAGSLAEVNRHLVNGCDVLEFDTLLDRGKFPQAGRWMSIRELMEPEMAASIDATVNNWTEFLFTCPSPGELALSREFRRASFGVAELVCLMTAAINLRIGEALLAERHYGKIVVAAGCGVNFPVWRELSEKHGIPLEILPVQSHRRTLWRLLTKKRLKAKQRKSVAPPTGQALSLVDLPDSVPVLCCSRAVGEILLRHGSGEIAVANAKELVATDPKEVAAHRATCEAWWREVPLTGFGSGVGGILSEVGGRLARDVYPQHTCIYRRAREVIGEKRPRVLLCDTQRGAAERMWALAARELGIPVIAYTYDHLLRSDCFFMPDGLVSDSGRNTGNAVAQGIPREKIIECVSHRLPRIHRRPGSGTLVVASDNFYSGDQAEQDPQVSYRLYRELTKAAREMPDVRFVLKFHPLRQKKSALRSFTGMDEQELANRKRHIAALAPPSNFRTAEPEESMLALLKTADALVNIESLTGVEAFCSGIPVIFLRPPVVQDFPLLPEYGAECAGDDLTAQLRRVLTNNGFRTKLLENQRRYVDDFYWNSSISLADAALTFAKP